MKTHFRFCLFAGLLCLAAALQFNRGLAQEPPKSADPARAAQPAAKKPVVSPDLLDIQHGILYTVGGSPRAAGERKDKEATLARVVDALLPFWPGEDIVLAPEVSKVRIEDLKLRSMRELWEVLEALRVASGYKFQYRRASSMPGSPPSASAPYILELGQELPTDPVARAQRMVEVFNLSGYLDRLPAQKPDEMRETVDGVMQIVGQSLENVRTMDSGSQGGGLEHGAPHFQFHPGTRLLVVTGPPDAIEVARKVISALTGVSSPEAAEVRVVPESVQRQFLTPEQEARQRYLRYGPSGLRNPPPAKVQPAKPGAAGEVPATPAAAGQTPH